MPDVAQKSLRYENAAVSDGQWWRLLSAHLVHLGWIHFLLNAGAALLLSQLFEQHWRRTDVLFGSAFIGIAICTTLYFFYTSIAWYVGLSGILHGLFAVAAVRMLIAKQNIAWLLLLCLALKLVYETVSGTASNEEMLGGQVIEEAHLWGAIAGLIYSGLIYATLLFSIRHTKGDGT
ncbi:MAG: rhombosortase [Pseudomonadales bacterium]